MTGVSVKVDGILNVISSLTKLGQRSGDLKQAFDRIGKQVKQDAIPLAPTATGALARSIRAGRTKNKATVRAGGASRRSHGGGVYAPIAHYGTYTHRSKGPRPFLTTAVQQNQGYARREISNELSSIIRTLGLGS